MKTEMKLKNKANEQQSIAVMANARVTVVIKTTIYARCNMDPLPQILNKFRGVNNGCMPVAVMILL